MNSQAFLIDSPYSGLMTELTFGEWLEDQYKSRGWLQQEFAANAGLKSTAISNWVNGRGTPEEANCDKIAVALGIDRNEVRRRAGRREVTIITPAPPPDTYWNTQTGKRELVHPAGAPDVVDEADNPLLEYALESGHKITPEKQRIAIRMLRALEQEDDER